MTTEAMRAAFEAWFSTLDYGLIGADRNGDGYIYAPATMHWESWKAATAAERERAALVCEALTVALDNGGKPYKREASASQCAAAIRSGK